MFPEEKIAAKVVSAMTNEKVLSASRMLTGYQNFVFAVKTIYSEYVIRMTNAENKNLYLSAVYWQKKLLPLGVPLAEFIHTDLAGKYSPFLSLLMKRLPGDDLCNVYLSLTVNDKKNIANELMKIHAITDLLPDGRGYGIPKTPETMPEDQSWHACLMKGLQFFMDRIKACHLFEFYEIEKVFHLANTMQEECNTVSPKPFLWDVGENNVLIYQKKISGIVDVDSICYGDPLLTLGLTYTSLESNGHDTFFADYWVESLGLNRQSQRRLLFYRLYITIFFISRRFYATPNNKKNVHDHDRLITVFRNLLARIE